MAIWNITATVITAVRPAMTQVKRISVFVCRDVVALNSLIASCSAFVAPLPDHSLNGIPGIRILQVDFTPTSAFNAGSARCESNNASLTRRAPYFVRLLQKSS